MVTWQTGAVLAIAVAVLTACGESPEADAPTLDATPTEPSTETELPESAPTAAPQMPDADAEGSAKLLGDRIIEPGVRVGPITRDTSRADLAAQFGEEALEDGDIPVGEGFTEFGTRANLGPAESFSVIWVDESRDRPATVKDFGSDWQTPEGIGIGTTFAELEAILGPFQLYGFDWDYGGTIVLENTQLANYYGSLILRVQPSRTAAEQAGDAYLAVTGDRLFDSDNPSFDSLGITVSEMIVYLNPPTQ